MPEEMEKSLLQKIDALTVSIRRMECDADDPISSGLHGKQAFWEYKEQVGGGADAKI
jgi:hypothetical protein